METWNNSSREGHQPRYALGEQLPQLQKETKGKMIHSFLLNKWVEIEVLNWFNQRNNNMRS